MEIIYKNNYETSSNIFSEYQFDRLTELFNNDLLINILQQCGIEVKKIIVKESGDMYDSKFVGEYYNYDEFLSKKEEYNNLLIENISIYGEIKGYKINCYIEPMSNMITFKCNKNIKQKYPNNYEIYLNSVAECIGSNHKKR